jgi:uncharacterized protein (DUF427 family)
MKATWNGAILAESDRTIVVEGNHYFPPDAVEREFLQSSDTHTICGLKGEASYLSIAVEGPPGFTRRRSRRPLRSRITSPSGGA